MTRLLALLTLLGCSSPDAPEPFSFPDPTDAPELRGPGGPTGTFTEAELFEPCAYLNGGPEDYDHHNLVAPYRGHLVMPWAPEWSDGGVSLFEFDDPCAPVKVSDSFDTDMRETHAIGFAHVRVGPYQGDWTVVNHTSGIQIWDISDAEAPVVAGVLELPNVFYPDSYSRVVLSVFWQYPYLYAAAANNGIFVIDTLDPYEPTLVKHVPFEPGLRSGGVFALGDTLLVTGAETEDAIVLDISDPENPLPIPGGRFDVADRDGTPREYYHGNRIGDLALFARKGGGSGPMIYDISDPTQPAFVGDLPNSDNGGYIFYDEGFLFMGESGVGRVYDARDMADIKVVGEVGVDKVPGDLDTLTPYGHVALLSADEEAVDDQATAVIPWRTDPDVDGPRVLAVGPKDGATGVAVTTRIGVGFNEMIEPSTVFAGSIRIVDEAGDPVVAWGSAQEAFATLSPKSPLDRDTTYTVTVEADGVTDANGHAIGETYTWSFTTAP
ncbi:MAG: Ig-like domain-containing protein [Proteobacteria bacterium]|nr:Ig-like domain-containing protein [Pseudomonadota bacterium]